MLEKAVITPETIDKKLAPKTVRVTADEDEITKTIRVAQPQIKVDLPEDPKVTVLMLKGENGNGEGPKGTKDYEQLENRPSINGQELIGNKTFEELGEETISNQELKDIIDKYYMEVFS